MAKLLIGLWSYPSSQHYGSKWGDVVKPFREKVEATSQELAKHKNLETKNAFQAIFVAPEYIFVGEDVGKKRIPMTEAQKNDLLRDLAAISNDFKKVLIFAGSIFYKTSLAPVQNRQLANANLIAATLKKNQSGFGDFVTTGWKPNGVNVPSLNEVAQKTTDATFRASNSVYAFLGGERVMTPYNKEFDCKETEGADPAALAYIPGSSSGTRTIAGFDFAIEVCADHASNALKGKKGYFHVVVSDWAETKIAHMVQENGFFMHASSNWQQTVVYDAAKKKVAPQPGSVSATDALVFWLVEVEKHEIAVPEITVPVQNPLVQGNLMKELAGKLVPKH